MFYIPTVQDLYSRIYNSFAAYASLDASLPLNNIQPTAKVFAGHSSEIFGRMDYIGQQAFVLLADELYLPFHAQQYGIPRKPAIPAVGNVAVVSEDDIAIPPETLFTRSDGAQYAATSLVSLASAGTAYVPVVALTTGAAANAVAGTPLTMDDSATGDGVDTATASVSADGIFNGADVEDLEDWRERILFRLRYPPHGGAPADYVMWGSAIPGVTRVFVWRRPTGPGTVRVFPVFDDYFAAQGGVASDPYITAVDSAIQEQAPATALVDVRAPAALTINVTATGLAPYTNPVKEAVMAELRDTFRRVGRVAGSDLVIQGMPFLASPQVFSRSWIWQAIANASGEQRHVLTQPPSDVTIPAGSIPVLGNVSLSA